VPWHICGRLYLKEGYLMTFTLHYPAFKTFKLNVCFRQFCYHFRKTLLQCVNPYLIKVTSTEKGSVNFSCTRIMEMESFKIVLFQLFLCCHSLLLRTLNVEVGKSTLAFPEDCEFLSTLFPVLLNLHYHFLQLMKLKVRLLLLELTFYS